MQGPFTSQLCSVPAMPVVCGLSPFLTQHIKTIAIYYCTRYINWSTFNCPHLFILIFKNVQVGRGRPHGVGRGRPHGVGRRRPYRCFLLHYTATLLSTFVCFKLQWCECRFIFTLNWGSKRHQKIIISTRLFLCTKMFKRILWNIPLIYTSWRSVVWICILYSATELGWPHRFYPFGFFLPAFYC